ncbi:hypothetical protein HD806DRAFT_530331 [Xylariaceae sp. AK1471]|nr:hypothetical protein HD806DRAFT_530331 [Xylariaceae sp. AK1471]
MKVYPLLVLIGLTGLGIEARETEEEFNQTTAALRKTGNCRYYFAATHKTLDQIDELCGQYCATQPEPWACEGPGTLAGIPTAFDLDNDAFVPGECLSVESLIPTGEAIMGVYKVLVGAAKTFVDNAFGALDYQKWILDACGGGPEVERAEEAFDFLTELSEEFGESMGDFRKKGAA